LEEFLIEELGYEASDFLDMAGFGSLTADLLPATNVSTHCINKQAAN